MSVSSRLAAEQVVADAHALRASLDVDVHARVTEALYARAERVAGVCVRTSGARRLDWERAADRLLTSRFFGYPIMIVGLVAVLWVTIEAANAPSAMLASAFFALHEKLLVGMEGIGVPWWLTGFLVDGVYLALAWVVSVMLPPMAIFFPIFTLLEDVGYLPRVAFNLDRLFRACGAHGKQALTMGMGLGCNAAGVISTRVIESPRERLIAILTNNFTLCNGRWPTIIMLSTVFVAARFPAGPASAVAAASVVGVALIGVAATLLVSKLLSRTVLKGEPSHFYLELPPYRVPNVFRVIHRSIVDRTIFVLGRACACAAPAGGLIWLLGNVEGGGASFMTHASGALDPIGLVLGLDGVILLAFIIALPANEIVVPTIIMAYMATARMTELDDMGALAGLFHQHGWTLTTAACVMLFSLLHYPCATTTWTIYRETRSWKWTIVANVMPLAVAVVACAAVAGATRALIN